MESGRSSRQSESSGGISFVKGPKRKRLAKACDACHKSKRRCDGTAPCGNCYYTSKTCTYTDSSGRAVPAPRDKLAAKSPATSKHPRHVKQPLSLTLLRERDQAEEDCALVGNGNGKRQRAASPTETSHTSSDDVTLSPAPGLSHGNSRHTLLDQQLTLELVNLCALAAPLSRQPRVQTRPSRIAGKDFGQEALSLMFDGAGRLICPWSLETAQALCLIRAHSVRIRCPDKKYHDLALQIVRSLGLNNPVEDNTQNTQVAIDRECMRRIFWNIYCTDLRDSIYARIRPLFQGPDPELKLRLPMDEMSFELFPTTLPEPEYLDSKVLPSKQASEFAHFIRVVLLQHKIENLLSPIGPNGPDDGLDQGAAISDYERGLKDWEVMLPDYLQFNEETIEIQKSMFETNANSGAWCFFCMHLYHASCALALGCLKQQRRSDPGWAMSRIENIIRVLGGRAKNTYLLPAAIWALSRYCGQDTSLDRYVCEVEDFWGINVLAQTETLGLHLPTSNGVPHLSPAPLSSSSSLSSSVALPRQQNQSPPNQHQAHPHPHTHSHPQSSSSLDPQLHPFVCRPQQGEVRAPDPSPPRHILLGPEKSFSEPYRSNVLPQVSPHRHMNNGSPLSVHSQGHDHRHAQAHSQSHNHAHAHAHGHGHGHLRNRLGSHDGMVGPGVGLPLTTARDEGLVPVGGPPAPAPVAVDPKQLSLPSLKASGLLDSWTHHQEGPGSLMPLATPGRGDVKGANVNANTNGTSGATNGKPTSGFASYGLPVGMSWLANEAR